jgi:hypothetical protein
MIELVQKKSNIQLTTPTPKGDVDLTNYYTKDEVNQIAEDLIDLTKVKYEGDNPPSDNPEDYSSNIKRGDIYYCKDEDRFYYVHDFYLDLLGFGGIVGVIWKPMITSGDVDNKITRALAAIGVAEGSEY